MAEVVRRQGRVEELFGQAEEELRETEERIVARVAQSRKLVAEGVWFDVFAIECMGFARGRRKLHLDVVCIVGCTNAMDATCHRQCEPDVPITFPWGT